jgi:hypothetical protein
MKKTNHRTRPLDSPKSREASPPVRKTASVPATKATNMSPERLMDGVSTTTELLNGILERQKQPEPMRHWGINE